MKDVARGCLYYLAIKALVFAGFGLFVWTEKWPYWVPIAIPGLVVCWLMERDDRRYERQRDMEQA